MIKQLRRRVIMRKYDYDRKLRHAEELYDTCTFEPYLRKTLEQEYIQRVLANTLPDTGSYGMPRDPVFDQGTYHLLRSQYDRLYNTKYLNAHLEEDDQGAIWIWYRSNTPRSILGLATFEYTYTGKDHDHDT